jgi:hypothetical protein
MQNIRTTNQMRPVNLLRINLNILQIQRSIFKILQCQLFFKELVEGLIQSVFDEMFEWIHVRDCAYDCIEYVAEHQYFF